MQQIATVLEALDTSIEMEGRTVEHQKLKKTFFFEWGGILSLEERSRILTLFPPSLQSIEFWTISKSPFKDITGEAEFFKWPDFDLNKRLKRFRIVDFFILKLNYIWLRWKGIKSGNC